MVELHVWVALLCAALLPTVAFVGGWLWGYTAGNRRWR